MNLWGWDTTDLSALLVHFFSFQTARMPLKTARMPWKLHGYHENCTDAMKRERDLSYTKVGRSEKERLDGWITDTSVNIKTLVSFVPFHLVSPQSVCMQVEKRLHCTLYVHCMDTVWRLKSVDRGEECSLFGYRPPYVLFTTQWQRSEKSIRNVCSLCVFCFVLCVRGHTHYAIESKLYQPLLTTWEERRVNPLLISLLCTNEPLCSHWGSTEISILSMCVSVGDEFASPLDLSPRLLHARCTP